MADTARWMDLGKSWERNAFSRGVETGAAQALLGGERIVLGKRVRVSVSLDWPDGEPFPGWEQTLADVAERER